MADSELLEPVVGRAGEVIPDRPSPTSIPPGGILCKLFQEIIGIQHPATAFSGFDLDPPIRGDHEDPSGAAGGLQTPDDEGIRGVVPTCELEAAGGDFTRADAPILTDPWAIAHKIGLEPSISAFLDQLSKAALIDARQFRRKYTGPVQHVAGVYEEFHQSESRSSRLGGLEVVFGGWGRGGGLRSPP